MLVVNVIIGSVKVSTMSAVSNQNMYVRNNPSFKGVKSRT